MNGVEAGMETEEELIQTIRDLAGFDPAEQARQERIADAGKWIERKIDQKVREGGEMTDAEIEGLVTVFHRSLTETC